MNLKDLDSDLIAIIEKKNQLALIGYDDSKYDLIEDQLHDLEDSFGEKYGDYLEEALIQVHDTYCPDSDVLIPIAYLGNKYIAENKDGKVYFEVEKGEGVIVDADAYPNKITRIVFLPSPTRIVLQVANEKRVVAWEA